MKRQMRYVVENAAGEMDASESRHRTSHLEESYGGPVRTVGNVCAAGGRIEVKPPGKTTLARMQHTAMIEAERIEITQDYWVREGRISEPEPHLVARRDDFAGIVRMIDAINSDQDLLDRLKRRMASLASESAPAPAAPEAEDGAADGSEASD